MSALFDLDDDNVFVIIGSGAGGATLANELAQKGVDVVCLEAGGRLDVGDIVNDPPKMDKLMGWHDPREGSPTWLCKTVGGTTMRWSAVALRMKPYEFRPLTEYGALEGTSLIDWPLTYEELAPYYAKAESKMGVSGTGDIPPSDETNHYKVLKAGGLLAGYKDITSSHMAINPVAIYLDKTGARHEQKARGVAIAGNVVETTRLLLNSKSSRFPNGLANSSGHVGRHYMKHQHASLAAIMPGPVNAHRGARQTGLIFDEWKHLPDRGFAVGAKILRSSC